MKNKELRIENSENGFSLVEVMISIGLFTVIMVIGIGAILGVNATSRKTQSMRAVVDNMSFIMEDMARSMRLGDYFVCIDNGLNGAINVNDIAVGGAQITADGEGCNNISFESYWKFLPTVIENQVVYYIGDGAVWKKEPDMDYGDIINNPITPPEITIDADKSGFFVTGSSRTDGKQPRITIVLAGTVVVGGVSTDFNMQTTVSQRVLDVESIAAPVGSTGTSTSTSTTIPVLPGSPTP